MPACSLLLGALVEAHGISNSYGACSQAIWPFSGGKTRKTSKKENLKCTSLHPKTQVQGAMCTALAL
jgi:hypothetical protein